MRLVRLLSLPYVARHRLRSLLTATGIALGSALLVAMHASNQSVLAGLRRTVTEIAGAAELQLSAGDAGVPEEVLDRVRALPQVGLASPAVEAVVDPGLPGESSILVLGIDVMADQGIRDWGVARVDDPLAFLAQPESILLTRAFARRNGLPPGASLPLETSQGRRPFRIRGLVGDAGFARAFGGNLAVMDVYAAQQVFGKIGVFDRIDIAARPGVSVDECRRALVASLGPSIRVESPSDRRRYFDQVLGNYRTAAALASFFALIVGLFLIQNTFAVAVAQRRVEIGILRALGATRGQIRSLFLSEAACLGLAGSLAGAMAGVAIGDVAARYVARSLEGLYGVPSGPPHAAHDWRILLAAVAAGVVCGLIGALAPAAAAARVDPVRALQRGRYEVLEQFERRYRRRLALCAAALGALLFFLRNTAAMQASYVLAAFTMVCIMPELCAALFRLARPLLVRLSPVEGALAADSLLQAPRRTAAAVSALALSVSMVLGLGGLAESSYSSIARWAQGTLDADFLVARSHNLKDLTFRFPAALEVDLAAIPGISVVQPVRTTRLPVLNSQPILFAIDVARIGPRARKSAVPVDTERVHRLAAAGKGLIVSTSFAEREGLHAGDLLGLPAPGGLLRLPVLATYIDFTDPQGAIVIDRSLYRSLWHDDTLNLFRLYLRPDASPERVRAQVVARCSARGPFFVFSSGDLRGYILGLAAGWFRITYAQLAVAILIAILGIANALTVSITDRRRELGILRAMGGLRRQVRLALGMEAALIAAAGFVVGVAFGVVNIAFALAIYTGPSTEFRFPWLLAAFLFPVLLAAALAASAVPAEAAVRAPLAAALESE
jgi:putative ABC transport system permease protein